MVLTGYIPYFAYDARIFSSYSDRTYAVFHVMLDLDTILFSS